MCVGSPLLSEEQLAAALFVRFQRVGSDGKGSDVGIDTPPPPQDVPEPTSMWLIGSGLAAAALRRRKRTA
jgi:PEP-CTERM motif